MSKLIATLLFCWFVHAMLYGDLRTAAVLAAVITVIEWRGK